jgi:deoxyhypusine synthase
MSEYLKVPVVPVSVDSRHKVGELIKEMGRTAFQGRNLAQAADIWEKMCQGQTIIFMGLAGAMVPAGMRAVILHLIKHRFIDCLVTTGANIFHDCYESLGRPHWQGTPQVDDNELRKQGIDRIYDVFASEAEFLEADKFITQFTAGLEDRCYTTREYLYLLGLELLKVGKEEGILSTAAQNKLPIYCPAIGDSSVGISIAEGRLKGQNNIQFDIIQDVIETTELSAYNHSTGVIYVGGGTPKNFIQQTEVSACILGHTGVGHQYAIQITTDAPHWGGLSGCTFEEAQSWGKIAQGALKTTVFCDATIALPILVNALEQNAGLQIRQRPRPNFKMGKDLEISF